MSEHNQDLDRLGTGLEALHLASLIMKVRRFSTWRTRVCLIRAGFIECDLSRVDLDRVDLRRCVLDRANLERTTWRDARAFECSLVGAVLVDAELDGATMVDCDLRGVDLSVVKRGPFATMHGMRLERCDLRASKWQGRSLSGVTLIDCKLFGAFGAEFVESDAIVRPDFRP